MYLGDMSGGDAGDNGQAQTTIEVEADSAEGSDDQQAQPPKEDGDTSTQDDEAKREERKRTGYQRKLDRKDAQIADLQRQISERGNDKAVVQQPADKPKLDSFETYEEYYEALADWKVEQKLKDTQSKQRETEMRKEMEAKANDYKAKASEFRKEAPDFDEVIEDYDGPWNANIQTAILESDVGPQVAYYLANNPDEADKMEGMNILQLNRFIGRIESKLESKSPSVVKATKAQPPITPVRKGSGAVTKDPGDMTLAEFEAWERNRKK